MYKDEHVRQYNAVARHARMPRILQCMAATNTTSADALTTRPAVVLKNSTNTVFRMGP
jgi:hypothetical protein